MASTEPIRERDKKPQSGDSVITIGGGGGGPHPLSRKKTKIEPRDKGHWTCQNGLLSSNMDIGVTRITITCGAFGLTLPMTDNDFAIQIEYKYD